MGLGRIWIIGPLVGFDGSSSFWYFGLELLMGLQDTKCLARKYGWALRQLHVKSLGPIWKIWPLID